MESALYGVYTLIVLKVSHSNRKTLNITVPDVLVNKIQNLDLEAES